MTWIHQLRNRMDDRGLMAALRCALVESKKHRAWPALHRLGADVTNRHVAVVAGLFATHPLESSSGNLGSTCAAIEGMRDGVGSDDTKVTPTERRFLQLLAASRDEIVDRVIRIVHLAKSQGVPINYVQLENDLHYWNDRTRQEWASAFWAPHAAAPTETGQGDSK